MERGVTLIELVVVIVVIGLLSTVLLSFLNPLKQIQRARDAKRITTLKQLSNVLMQYYRDNGQYPSTGGNWYSSERSDSALNGPSNNGSWIPGLSPNYMQALPKDPTGGVGVTTGNTTCALWKKAYLYRSDGQNYALLAHCSIEATTWDEKFGFYDPQQSTWAWKVCQGAGCSYSVPNLNRQVPLL